MSSTQSDLKKTSALSSARPSSASSTFVHDNLQPQMEPTRAGFTIARGSLERYSP